MCQHTQKLKKAFFNFKSTMVTSNMETSKNDESLDVSGVVNLVRKGRQRRKIWELEHNYHCAVIGTCLTLLETRKLVSHFVKNTADMSEYDYHTHAVHMISYNDKPGKKIQNFLDNKFKTTINQFKKMQAEQLRCQWRGILKSGDVISTFWALITHPDATKEMIKDAYGDIHMMSHLSGAGNRADLNQLKQLRSERVELRETCVTWQSRFQQELVESERLRKKLGYQQEKNQQISRELVHTQLTIKSLIDRNSEKVRLNRKQKIDKLKQELNHLDKTNQKLTQQNIYLNLKMKESNCCPPVKTQTLSSHNSIDVPMMQSEILDDNCNDCPFGETDDEKGLCGRCILYVGGRTRLTPHFKKLVENKEGTFLHHDGGMEQSAQALSSLLNKADLVVFPVDCVSHKAYFQLKKACKKQQKPYKALNSSGVSSFSTLLDNLSAQIL